MTANQSDPAASADMPPKGDRRRSASQGWRRHAGWLVANLMVVFLGVYAAFVLDQLREDRRDRQRLVAFERALLHEFASTAKSLEREGAELMASFRDPFLDALDAGERPRPQPLPFAVGELDTGTWRAMMEAGGVELLDPSTVIEIEHYYATLDQLLRDLLRFERLSDRYLIPTLEAPPETFYRADGSLRASWRWYEATLRQLPGRLAALAGWAGSIAERLEARVGPVEHIGRPGTRPSTADAESVGSEG